MSKTYFDPKRVCTFTTWVPRSLPRLPGSILRAKEGTPEFEEEFRSRLSREGSAETANAVFDKFLERLPKS